jgi:DNA modification methylase
MVKAAAANTILARSVRRTKSRNALRAEDAPIHNWYRFVLSYPPHLVSEYLDKFGATKSDWVLDPFCGTGTTLVECRKRGIPSVGTEAHPMPLFATRVKTNWGLEVPRLRALLRKIAESAERELERDGLPASSFNGQIISEDLAIYEKADLELSLEEKELIPTGFLSARPLRRLLTLRKAINKHCSNDSSEPRDFFLLGLATVIVAGAGNFAFGPEIYRTKPKADYDVVGHFVRHATQMIADLEIVERRQPSPPPCIVYADDARVLKSVKEPISAVITSPPYPNEKDYTRATRVESVLLGLIRSKKDLRSVKESLLRSNTRNVFVNDSDAQYVQDVPSVLKVCSEIESRRIELGKTSGFERLYHKVVAHYFGGMRRHFRSLLPKLRKGAKCAYVVGDQLSFLMVPVPTAALLSEVAEQEGFKVVGCDLWRERIGTKVRNARVPTSTVRVRENVLLLEKP